MNGKKHSGLIGKIILLAATVAMVVTLVCVAIPSSVKAETLKRSEMLDKMMETATSYVVVYHKQMGGSHYAYTEGLAEEMNSGATASEGNEANFSGGSKMTVITLRYDGDNVIKEETTIVNSRNGVIRDPSVSSDGTKIVYSMKTKETDDYHLYIYDMATGKSTQITFGSGVADIEPVFNADGTIVFNSTRDIQTVDCWYTPVSNLYKCDADGSNIVRLGYDQVHTTFPTTTEDGRIIYTRWDYNDRNQMYVQAIFQMFADGTNQTELFGNNLSAPTSLIHTREIPGTESKYVTITCGHHQRQCGKLAILDTSVGRNDMNALDFVWDDQYTRSIQGSHDNDVAFYQEGRVYKYPYAISENEILVSTAPSYTGTDTAFNIELINASSKKQESVVIAKGTTTFPASQIVPIKTSNQFNRASLVNYSQNYGTYYVGNVYQGQSGIKAGTIKYLRIVGLEFRSSAIGATNGRGTGSSDPYSPISTGNGAWDIKKVLGIVPVYEDGSALFTCPAGVPVYFQMLNEDGDVVQTMRSWTTLQPGEYFSCVGCHVDKNLAPSVNATITQAMNHGVSEIQPDLWMESFEDYEDYNPYNVDGLLGFDYLSLIQPILDKSCITCHSESAAAYNSIKASTLGSADLNKANYVTQTRDSWYYTTSNPGSGWETGEIPDSWTLDYAPFGKIGTAPGSVNTVWTSGEIYLRKTVSITNAELFTYSLNLHIAYTGTVEVSVNGTNVYTGSGTNGQYQDIALSANAMKAFKAGDNEIAVKVKAAASGQYFDLALVRTMGGSTGGASKNVTLISNGATWSYFTSAKDEFGAATAGDWTKTGFNTSGWSTAKAPFGDREGKKPTDWATGGKNYIFLRYTFTVNDLADLGASFNLYTKIFYDDDIHIYLNGHQIFENANWNDGYETLKLASGARYVQKGENVIAVCLQQHTGGYEFDMSLYSVEEATNVQISLQGTDVYASRMKKAFPLSYLLLTASSGESNGQFVANNANKYTNWVSSMSKCEMLDPYSNGAYKSALIRRLREGHGDLTEAEIRAIACWIDLGVPCYGSYEVKENWGTNEIREYEEELNKREFYDTMDKYAKLARAGLATKGEITITYKHSGKDYTATGEGMVILNLDAKYAQNDTLSVKLPDGEKYLALSLSSRVGESIIYCPNSTFEMKIPNLTTVYPNTMDSGQGVAYIANTITARLVSEGELTEVHNLARNSYDLSNATTGFPHVTTVGSIKDSKDYYAGRNVIDGFTANKSKGEYPAQSWQPASIDAQTALTIDFGRKVKIDELRITVRRADGDSYFTDCILTLSDGSTRKISLTNSAQEQVIDLGGVETTSITFSGFTVETSVSGGNNYGITEIKAMGTEVLG